METLEIYYGWELIEVKEIEHEQRICVFKNLETGEILEHRFGNLIVFPKSKPDQLLIDSGLTNSEGMVDVNPYTLQHKKYENIFAFGDCTSCDTHKTQSAVLAQIPVL